jgi:hypothetical protein
MRNVPAFQSKMEMEEHLLSRAEQGTFTYTGINTGLFLDFALARGMPVNLLGGPTRIMDGGDVPYSTSALDTIGEAVAAALEKYPDPKLINTFLTVHSLVVTQNQLLQWAKEVAGPEHEFPTVHVDTEELFNKGLEMARSGDKSPTPNHLMMARGTFGLGKGKFDETANEYLGIEEWDEERVKDVMRAILEKGRKSA